MYDLIYDKKYLKSLRKLDIQAQKIITNWVENNLLNCEEPRFSGKPLTGNFKGVWRYRIGSYRLLAKKEYDKLIIFAINRRQRRNI
ncbi:type II toxin-antitoxin system RelE/ParE family toxin [uncultured Peptoniphilus sp.]|uniref:type II toxin-antitoxin system RelE family toxin n=1 Tax=uncultured Peptoniphilus sp. TaxID=254354 RepID=UPI002588DAB2|nr:type II toxin-antitoxin system RelE/ParE family toxin [uncultured Peptoniphilus sp.]MDU6783395.1 type II toxin-antitoxin system RelE/ParE family toxin [Peptoniphilus harei]